MRATVAGLILTALPAAAQWKLPDRLPALEQGKALCNDAGTHCLLNSRDLAQLQAEAVGVELLGEMAGRALMQKDAEIDSLKAQLARERAQKTVHCADVKAEGKS